MFVSTIMVERKDLYVHVIKPGEKAVTSDSCTQAKAYSGRHHIVTRKHIELYVSPETPVKLYGK